MNIGVYVVGILLIIRLNLLFNCLPIESVYRKLKVKGLKQWWIDDVASSLTVHNNIRIEIHETGQSLLTAILFT